jgi:hypothetical protein
MCTWSLFLLYNHVYMLIIWIEIEFILHILLDIERILWDAHKKTCDMLVGLPTITGNITCRTERTGL